MSMFGALKDLGVNEEESPKLWHYVINGALLTEAAANYATDFKVLLKKTFFFSKHLLDFFQERPRKGQYKYYLTRYSLTEEMCHKIS